MALHDILHDRAAVNALKLIYLNERIEQKYSIELRNVKEQLPVHLEPHSLKLLQAHGLISIDSVEHKTLLAITEKGKKFIDAFDNLGTLFRPVQQKARVRLEYSLTPIEWQVLLLLQKIQRETGEEAIPLKVIRDELYPHHKTSISAYVKQLEQLNLIEKQQRGREIWLCFSAQGKKMMQEKLMGIV